MSLLNDLIPEVRERLEVDKEQYPFLYTFMMEDMQRAMIVKDLTVQTASQLISYAENAKVKFEYDDKSSFLVKLYNVFGR